MTTRKLQALRNLAERPGTAAEGEVAKSMLAKAEAKSGAGHKPSPFATINVKGDPLFASIIRDLQLDLAEMMRKAVDAEMQRILFGSAPNGAWDLKGSKR